MTYTGGPLNELNGKMGISAPFRSVPVMKLIKVHQPKSKDELVELIAYHSTHDCGCGIVSKGTVESFGKKLYEAQLTYWGKQPFSLQQCIQWEYDLFVTQSLKGGKIEKQALAALGKLDDEIDVKEAQGYLDEELRIDLLILRNGQEIAGVQVKPETFLKMRREVVLFNKNANHRWNKPVLYLYYDDKEEFSNLEALKSELLRI